ncbi:MAG: DUF2442 domain-containing protein [Firmicutes bacterium]|nr:DUF2442 domain-containing protein [Bacillota bacterium]
MIDSHYPIDVKPLKYHKLLITFDNDEQRIFDLEPYLSDGYFAPLGDIAVFDTVRISPISIEWAGGIDICPDELYYNSVPAENF